MENQTIVEMRDISKSFPGVKALDKVNLTLERGTVHALVGENGAGKSTLMKVLTGTYKRDTGDVIYKGQVVNFHGERDAIEAGIAIVPQELSYVPGLTVEENIYLGREPVKATLIDKKKRRQMVSELIAEMELHIDPRAKMSDLNIAQCQMIEIIKAISRGAEVVVFDEPTSSLTSVETEQLFKHIRNLREKGIAIVYISHKLDEILELSDKISVLRDSTYIGSMTREEATEEKIVNMMVGREMGKVYPPVGKCTDEEILRVEHFTQPGVFEDVSFTLHKGEVLGFSGMVGAGRSEVMRAVFGIDPHASGDIYIDGKKSNINSTGDAIDAGICMVFEDRRIFGFVGGLSVKENIALPSAKEYSTGLSMNFRKIKEDAEAQRDKLRIKTPSIEQKVMNLSGGNQQKVVLAKWLNRENVKVLIMDEPTRGIDVGAKQEIYEMITQMAADGMAIIMISSEMPEVINVSQRIIVMDGGHIVGEVKHEDATQEGIMNMIIQGGRKV
jgi:ABC-type sugar transport system ATPase subunit